MLDFLLLESEKTKCQQLGCANCVPSKSQEADRKLFFSGYICLLAADNQPKQPAPKSCPKGLDLPSEQMDTK